VRKGAERKKREEERQQSIHKQTQSILDEGSSRFDDLDRYFVTLVGALIDRPTTAFAQLQIRVDVEMLADSIGSNSAVNLVQIGTRSGGTEDTQHVGGEDVQQVGVEIEELTSEGRIVIKEVFRHNNHNNQQQQQQQQQQ
jgi:hypothetical protein